MLSLVTVVSIPINDGVYTGLPPRVFVKYTSRLLLAGPVQSRVTLTPPKPVYLNIPTLIGVPTVLS